MAEIGQRLTAKGVTRADIDSAGDLLDAIAEALGTYRSPVGEVAEVGCPDGVGGP